MYLQILILMVSICVFFSLRLDVSNTRSHVYTFGAGTGVPEIKYSGDGIYRSSPPPSMEDRDSFTDPQRPCGSSRLDYIFFNVKQCYMTII